MAEELSPQTVSDLLTKAGFAQSDRTGREVGGFPEFSEGFTVSPDWKDSVLVMHDTGARRDDPAQVRPMLDKYREALAEVGFAAELREEPLALIVKWK